MRNGLQVREICSLHRTRTGECRLVKMREEEEKSQCFFSQRESSSTERDRGLAQRRGREAAQNWTAASKWSHTQSGTYTVFVASCCVVTQCTVCTIQTDSMPPPPKQTNKRKSKPKEKRQKKICEIKYKNLYIHIIYAYEMHTYIH